MSMKNFIPLLFCLLLFVPAVVLAEDGWFAAADLSEEEWNLLTVLMMDEIEGPYDFKAPNGATHLSLTLLKWENGQWVERHTSTERLTPSASTTELTITAKLTEEGKWESDIQENSSQADGRIYINPVEPPNTFGFCIWQPHLPDTIYSNVRGAYLYEEERINTFDLHCYQRTFLNPERNGQLQQKVPAVLNEPVLLELYVCFFDGSLRIPSFSDFDDPAAFADFDHAFAVTATFSDQSPQ